MYNWGQHKSAFLFKTSKSAWGRAQVPAPCVSKVATKLIRSQGRSNLDHAPFRVPMDSHQAMFMCGRTWVRWTAMRRTIWICGAFEEVLAD